MVITNLLDVINLYDNKQRLVHNLGLEKDYTRNVCLRINTTFVRRSLDNKLAMQMHY